MAAIILPRKHYTQPQGRVSAAGNLIFGLCGPKGMSNHNGDDVDLRSSFDAVVGESGYAVRPNTNRITLDINAQEAALYSGILHFRVLTSDITASSSSYNFVSDIPDVSSTNNGIFMGASTGFLTDETIAFVNTSSGGRTGITQTIQMNREHTLVFQWIGIRYEIWLNGALPEQISNGGNHAILRVMKPHLGGRTLSNQPAIEWMFAAFSNDPSFDARNYVSAPYAALRKEPHRIYSLPPVLTIPSLSNPGVIDITATSARPQVTLAY